MKNLQPTTFNPLHGTYEPRPLSVCSALVTVTPVQAAQWLTRNTHNRGIRPARVQQYAADMRSGQWHITGSGPRFAHDGTLLDGQHTLQAVIDAGVPVQMFVFWNLELEAQRNIDDLRKRTYSDHLKLAGVPSHASVAAVVRRAWLFAHGEFDSTGAEIEPTKAQLDRFMDRHPLLQRSAQIGCACRRGDVSVSPAVAGCAHFVFARIDPDEADRFMEQFRAGIGLTKGSPLLMLRHRIATAPRLQTNTAEVLAWFMRTWDAHVAGRTLTRLAYRPSDPFPLPRGYEPAEEG